jgi:hypothetical protein
MAACAGTEIRHKYVLTTTLPNWSYSWVWNTTNMNAGEARFALAFTTCAIPAPVICEGGRVIPRKSASRSDAAGNASAIRDSLATTDFRL